MTKRRKRKIKKKMKSPKLLKADETMAKSEGSMSEDTVIEILSKLPVKSLLRFKCVCKFWHELFGSPGFISKHRENKHNTRLVVRYLADDEDDPHEEPLCICLFHDETLADVSLREDILPLLPREACPMGPFEWGFFCCISDTKQEIGLWNFATRDYKILPKIKPDSFWTIYGVGLGMDQKSNCSKLVCAMAIAEYDHNDVLKSSDSNQVAIYSFDTNSWRNFQSLELSKYKFEVGDTSKGRYQNGGKASI